MKYILSTAAFALGASAGVLKQRAASSCCFGITVNGGSQSGSLGQLDDGQNRVGPGFGGASYCLSGTSITDEAGRGCVIAEPSTQFQCDLNSLPTSGFAISSTGEISYNGQTTFYECAATANSQYNIYTTPAGTLCTEVTLSTTGMQCAASNSFSSAAPTTVVTTATLSASTVTMTAPGSTVTVSGAGSTVTLPASTVTISGAASTVTLPAATVTVSEAPSTVTVTSVQSCVASTVTVTGPGMTVVQTAEVTEVQTAAPTTVVQTAKVTEIQTVVETTATTAYQTAVETAPASTVEQTKTVVESVAPTTVVSVITSTPASSAPATSTSATSSSVTPSSTSCPADLSGNYQYPHLIIPVNSSAPTTAYGTQYFGQVSSTVSTIFNFDVPSSYTGNTCSLIFLLPTKAQLETSDYTVSGSGSIEVLQLSSPATSATTFANQPSVEANLGTFDIAVGSSTVIATSACAAGETVSYELKATGSYALYFFEDYNPSPLGLYIREC